MAQKQKRAMDGAPSLGDDSGNGFGFLIEGSGIFVLEFTFGLEKRDDE
jgi:hypothetical protein